MYAGEYERGILPELVEDQRKYSSKVIYSMIKHAKINNTDCNINIRDGGLYFVIDEGTSKHAYTNIVKFDNRRKLSNYECILTRDKSKLNCERGLPHNSNRQKGLTYIRLTINLDGKGYATSMHGNETTEYEIFGQRVSMLDSVNSKFSCNIQIPSKLKDPAIVNNGRGDGMITKNRNDDSNIEKNTRNSATEK